MESTKHRAHQHFLNAGSSELLQMDLKNYCGFTDGGRCYSLPVLDDHSRFLLGLFVCADEWCETACQAMTRVFETYGLPQRILMANPEPWKGGPFTPYNQLTVWLMRLGMPVSHSRCCPQAQGKDERLHRTLGDDVLRGRKSATLAAFQAVYDLWRHKYNHQRPCQALDLDTPAQH